MTLLVPCGTMTAQELFDSTAGKVPSIRADHIASASASYAARRDALVSKGKLSRPVAFTWGSVRAQTPTSAQRADDAAHGDAAEVLAAGVEQSCSLGNGPAVIEPAAPDRSCDTGTASADAGSGAAGNGKATVAPPEQNRKPRRHRVNTEELD